MKILLLNPFHGGKKNFRDPILTRCAGVASKGPYAWPPIGLAYIASSLMEFSGADVKIIDAQVDDFDLDMAKKSDLVVMNSSTTTINQDVELSKKLKELIDINVALMGLHPAYFHKNIAKCCDFVIRGEPDSTLPNLVRSLEKYGDARNAKGITWKDSNNKVRINKDEKPAENLDIFPFQAADLLSTKYFDITSKRKPISFMITSRGCPYGCKFCSAKFYSKKYRSRTTENVVGEMKFLKDNGFKDITFFDDSFTVSKKRVMEICRIIRDEKLDVAWRCLSRVDTVDEEMLVEMKNSGCYQIQFGVESGDQRMLDLMKKGTSLHEIRRAFRLCDKTGIETVGFFLLGYPGETLESIGNTIKMAHEIVPDFVTFNLFTPLPGSEIFKFVKRKEWENYDFLSTSFCSIPSDNMLHLIRVAYGGFYFRPSYLLRRIIKTGQPARIIKQNLEFWGKRSGVLWDFIAGEK